MLKDTLADAAVLTFVIPSVTVFPRDKQRDFRMFIVKACYDENGYSRVKYRYFPTQNSEGIDFFDTKFIQEGFPPEIQGVSLDETGWRISELDLGLTESYVTQFRDIINRQRSGYESTKIA